VLRDLDPTELLDRMALEVTKLAQKLARLGVLGIETDNAARIAACHSAP
jgi:hypothetical protein